MGKKILLKRIIVLFLLVLLFSELAPTPYPLAKREYDLVIAQITDTHIGFLGSPGKTARALFRAGQEADLIVITGDCTEYHEGAEGEFVQLAALLQQYQSVPVRCLPGNHDFPKLFVQYLGDLQWTWEINGYRLVGLNSRTRKVNLNFLEKACQTNKPVVLLVHHNIELIRDSADIKAMIEKYPNIIAWISGHLHFQWERVNSHGIIYIQGGWGWTGRYQLICLKDGKVAKVIYR